MSDLSYIRDAATGLPVTHQQRLARVAELLASLNSPTMSRAGALPLLRELARWVCDASASEIGWRRWRIPGTDEHRAMLERETA